MSESRLTRRQFVKYTGLAASAAVASACRPAATPAPTVPPTEVPTEAPEATPVTEATPTPAPPEAAPSKYKEAPMLAELVAQGKLPPVDERLPKEPKLVNEHAAHLLDLEVGQYGGTARFGTTTPEFDAELFVACNEPLINTPSILGEEFTPNILKDFTVSDDQTEFTFTLREGLRWSDGELVTTEDVRFAVEDVLFNEELTAAIPPWLRSANKPSGDPLKLEVVDDFTFKISFSDPYGGFITSVAIQGWRSYVELLKPAHYLKQFHIKYTSLENLEPLIKEQNLDTWVQLFALKDITNWEMCRKEAIGFPMLYPWLIKDVSADRVIYERNPYYFKVDADGQQLPYFDRLHSWIMANQDIFTMKQLAGEIDFTARFTVLTNLPLYMENEKNGYRVYLQRDHVTHSDIFLNLTYDDPTWRQIVRDVRFRKALNMAIDRAEILDAVYYGYGEMPTIVPSEYDPEEAEKLLDEVGMDQRDGDGFRLTPDGQPFVIPFEYFTTDPTFAPVAEILAENWKAVGINTTAKGIDNALWGQRNAANELQASILWTVLPLWYWPDMTQGLWCPLWNRWWNTGGQDGEEPPAEIKTFYEKMAAISVVSPEQGRQAYEEARKLVYDNVWFMPPLENIRQVMLVNANFGNIPDDPSVISIAVDFSFEQVYLKS